MTPEDAEVLIADLAATAEILGTQLSKPALAMMADDLRQYALDDVRSALAQCRREGRMTLAGIIDRLKGADKRPGPEEAWAQCLPAIDERETVVWTNEMQDAFSAARTLLDAGDKIGARMAFKESYERMVSEARAAHRPAQWMVSLGWDVAKRAGPIREALQMGRLSQVQVQHCLPPPEEPANPLLTSVEYEKAAAGIRALGL